MANKKVFTDESLATLVSETKTYVDSAVSTKANSSHNHSASNITSGTLSSDRLPTVPIAKGGTGATTAAGALTNLGITATATELNYVDGVTSNIQSQLNNKAASSHGTHVSYSTTAPVMDGTASAGSASTVARSDHKHPTDTSRASQEDLDALESVVAGKADTHSHPYAGSSSQGGAANSALKLDTARAINGVNFDGTAPITITANPTETSLTGVDLNDYKSPGFYYGGGNNGCTNVPSGIDAFGMVVFKNAGGYTCQLLVGGNNKQNIMYVRTYTSSAWSAWATQYSDVNKPTPSEIGAATSGHNHDDRYYTESEINTKVDTLQNNINGKVDKVSGKGLSTNDYTTTEKTKLAGIADNAQVNQNAFSNVLVGSTTIAADSTTDTLTVAAGTGITVTPDATNDKITITNSGVRSIGTGSENGTISVNTNGASANVAVKGLGSAAYTASTSYDAAGTAQTKADAALASAKSYADTKVANLINGAPTTLDTLKEIADAMAANDTVVDALESAVGNKVDKVSGKGLSTNDYTTTEKNKLAGIASGAEVNQNAFSNVTVGSTTIAADGKTDTLTIASGGNITITPDASADKVTFTVADGTTSAKGVVQLTNSTSSTSTTTAATPNSVKSAYDLANTAKTTADSKQATITGAATTITGSNLTASRALVSDANGKVAVSAVTSTELGYLDGVTKSVQTQLDERLKLSGGTLSGNVEVKKTDETYMTSKVTNSKGSVGLYAASNRGLYDFTKNEWMVYTNSSNNVVTLNGNCTGNAGTATKLATARTIGIGNDFSGSATFDGSSNITISAKYYSCDVNSGNVSNLPWHRIAYTGDVTNNYNDKDMIIMINSRYHNGKAGILKVSFRADSITTSASASVSAIWLVRKGFSVDDVKIALYKTTGKAYADLYLKVGTYARCTVYQLSGNRAWTLVSSTEHDSSSTNTPVECYETVESAATALYNLAYTSIASSTEDFAVNYANSAGSSTKVTATATNPTSGTTYYLPFHSGATTGSKSLLTNDGLGYYSLQGTTSALGSAELKLGNNIASGTVGNKVGKIYMYGSSTGYTYILPTNNTTSNITVNLPSTGGTLALNTAATQSANGLMSAADKKKLDGIATGANAYTHPTTSGNKHIPSGGSSGQILRWSADGTAVWGNDNNTTYTLGSFGLTATADELNYCDGVTSNIQTQLNSITSSRNMKTYHELSQINCSTYAFSDVLNAMPDNSKFVNAVEAGFGTANSLSSTYGVVEITRVNQWRMSIEVTDSNGSQYVWTGNKNDLSNITLQSVGGSATTDKANKDSDGYIINRSYVSLRARNEIPANADLNTANYIKVGTYYCANNANTTTLKNCPTAIAFMMHVYAPINTSIDDETTQPYRYRVRKIINISGEEWVSKVSVDATVGQLTYGAWSRIITSAGNIETSNGYLKSTANGNTVSIGSQNATWCHFQNSANIPFHFNKAIHAQDGFTVYGASVPTSLTNGKLTMGETSYNDGYIELSGTTPFIDFHYNDSTSDYSTRLYCGGEESLALHGGNFYVGSYNDSAYHAAYVMNTTGMVGIHISASSGNAGLMYNNSAVSTSGAEEWMIYRTDDGSIIIPNSNVVVGKNATGQLKPHTTNKMSCGVSGNIWTQVFAKTSTISSSDRNQKKDIRTFDSNENYEKFFMDLKPIVYKFKDGESGRDHFGFISQDVEESLYKFGFDDKSFAGFCRDARKVNVGEEGEEKYETVYDEDGNVQYDYALRYSEFISLNTYMIQKLTKENQELKDECVELRTKNDKLETRLQAIENMIAELKSN